MMAQAAHAASAVQHEYADHPDMKRYLNGEDGLAWMVMRKAVLEVGCVCRWKLTTTQGARLGDAAYARFQARRGGLPSPPVDGGAVSRCGREGGRADARRREHTPTALALVPNKRPKALKKILDEAGVTLWK